MFTLDIYDQKGTLEEYIEEVDGLIESYSQYSIYPIGFSFKTNYRDNYIIDYIRGVARDYDDIVFTLGINGKHYYIKNETMVLLPNGE